MRVAAVPFPGTGDDILQGRMAGLPAQLAANAVGGGHQAGASPGRRGTSSTGMGRPVTSRAVSITSLTE